MAKSTIQRPDGTVIEIDGSPEEIARIIKLYGVSDAPTPTASHPKATTPKSKIEGQKARIVYLINGGFFSEKRKLEDIRSELENNGWIYEQKDISNTVRRLVADDKVLRRKKEEGLWVYFNP